MPRNQLFLAFASLCIVNAAIRPALALLEREGAGALLAGTMGIKPFVWGALTLGVVAVLQSDDCRLRSWDRPVLLFSSGLLLVPIATISWLAMSFALCWAALSARDSVQAAGYSILAAVGLREPLAAIGLKLFAGPVLALDATLAASLLSLVWTDAVLQGNIIQNQNGHQLFIMTGCASYTNLSFAFLAWFAVARFRCREWLPRFYWHGAVVAFLIVALNIARLAAMAISKELYEFLHDGAGTTLVELATVAIVALAILWSGRLRHAS